jgi:hypothetical protein
MTNKLNITRRDFINGVALGLAGGTTLSPTPMPQHMRISMAQLMLRTEP